METMAMFTLKLLVHFPLVSCHLYLRSVFLAAPCCISLLELSFCLRMCALGLRSWDAVVGVMVPRLQLPKKICVKSFWSSRNSFGVGEILPPMVAGGTGATALAPIEISRVVYKADQDTGPSVRPGPSGRLVGHSIRVKRMLTEYIPVYSSIFKHTRGIFKEYSPINSTPVRYHPSVMS